MIIQSIPNDFSVCKVEDYSLVNWRAEYVFTAKTDEENSPVCLTQDAPANTMEKDDGWRAACSGHVGFRAGWYPGRNRPGAGAA